ncbi:MAG: hypothetical protein COU90_01140 [Candidatus Ryanbacteria bacterium CG10_big_fil_rev_8_21_14_0_10_43_42]|uniref:Uncharacterized protein n=1 Tax=Candidatus Ryanbacteria bacterium CG10_big_fil_rev_8_21_14_0_10_43_42 TaxID=1974864 RepID=A0A2M8KY87_9BACT|nr:MAG: hypothetical protein COU90_01140 [Candidatus Ryanbacteria bacterium CG10_big_fil_rev_8_21_14_0_10_43_42]
MKRLPIAIIVLVLIGVGYYFLVGQDGELEEETKTPLPGSFSGVVTNVDLDAMAYDGPALITVRDDDEKGAVIAVPSMGLSFCEAFERIALVGDIEVGDQIYVEGDVDAPGRIVPCEDPTHYLTVTKTVRDRTRGYEFTYRKGPDGYIMLENTESQDIDFISGVMLMNRNEYEELQNSTDAREGPPAIHIRVYQNPDNLSAFVWPERKSLESNVGLALDDPKEAVVGGANASFYTADGLYPIDTYIIANGQYVYVLMGAYRDKESDIYKDFQSLVNSFTFIQAQGQN